MKTRASKRLPQPALLSPFIADLFDLLPDVVFFIKDRAGRYTAVNSTLVSRCGLRRKADLLGRSVGEVFPPRLAETYAAQDRLVLDEGLPITGKLELHLYPDRKPGWCLTTKLPLRDAAGRIAGLAGLSRDVQAHAAAESVPSALADTINFLATHFHEPLTVRGLAARAGMSANAFGRLVKRLFHLTPSQLLQQARLQAAAHHLRETRAPMATIAQTCGYYDQSALSRHFKAATGLTPRAYRQLSPAG